MKKVNTPSILRSCVFGFLLLALGLSACSSSATPTSLPETAAIPATKEKSESTATPAAPVSPDFQQKIEEGKALIESGEIEKAIQILDQIIASDPQNASAYVQRAIAKSIQEDYEAALADFNKAVELRPMDAVIVNTRGGFFAGYGKYEEALADFERAIQLDPNYASAYVNQANIFADMGEYEKAIADYNRALELKNDLADVYYNRGTAYGLMEQFDKAVEDFRKYIELAPDDPWGYYRLASAYAELGDLDTALFNINKAIEILPDEAEIYFLRGLIYAQKRLVSNAIADFQKVIELSESEDLDAQAQEWIQFLQSNPQ